MSKPDRSKAPSVAAITDIAIAPERIAKLRNGIDLHIVGVGEQPLSRLTLIWEGGAQDMDNPSHPMMMAECLKEGTESISGAEIADCMDFNGARLSTRASEHYIGMDLLSLNSKFSRVLPTINSIICNPTFADKAIDVIRQRSATNRAVQMTRVSNIASEATRGHIAGPEHKAARILQPEEVLATTRQNIIETYNATIGRGHLHAYLAGAPDEELVAQVSDFLESLPGKSGESAIKIVPFNPQNPTRINITKADAQQAAVTMVMPTIMRNHPDYIDLRIAVMALGGYFGSRLMSNIREEKGLTYGINASLCGSYEGAYIDISAQCDASFVEQVIEESCKEIANLWENPPQGEELHRIKLHVWSSLAASADNPFSISDYYLTRRLVGTTDTYFEDQLAALKALTPQRIAEVAKKYLNRERMTIAVAGPC